jgi:3-oxoacyl-[acyl-carrier protein] reductase
MRLDGRVAVVTGGGKGIGKAYCKGLAAEGAKVVVADIDVEAATSAADEIRAAGGSAHPCRVDVASEVETRAMAEFATRQFGGIDILINNAAMYANLTRKNFDKITPEEFDRVLAVNVKGVWLCTLACVPAMRARGGGKIVNIGSGSVFVGGNGLVHYVASKMGVTGLTRALARELGDDKIKINTLIPGLTDSSSNAANTSGDYLQTVAQQRCLKRIETPDDLIGALVFLSSSESDFITGQSLNCDGGFLFI